MSGTLRIFRGLPGSGKTTMARELGGRLAGRDHIRELLGVEGVGTPKQEAEVTELQNRLIAKGLRNGETVNVDDMNLRSSYVSRLIGLAQKYGADWVIKDLSHVDIDLCHVRNLKRSRVVPEDVIERNYDRFIKGKGYPLPVPTGKLDKSYSPPDPYVPDVSKPKAVLIDIDGTVADHEKVRGHHEYHRVSEDWAKHDVIAMVRAAYVAGYDMVFMSGRPDSCREATVNWIITYFDHEDFILFMRETGDHRADYVVKNELFDKHVRHDYNVVAAFDDRDQVVEMYREMGLTVFQVAEGNF